MIKGKTLIELTDVKTGVTEVIREDNMVTNMLKSIYGLSYFGPKDISTKRPLGNLSLSSQRNNNNNAPNLIGDFIGGILCYSDPVQEDVNTFYASLDNEVIAHAATNINDDAQNLKRGSFNEKESGPTGNNGYKFVWDFATTQGNGEISSICLTSYLGGLLGDIQHAEYLIKTKQLLLESVGYSDEINNKRVFYQYVYSSIVEVNIEENTGTAVGFIYKNNQPKIMIWKVRLPLTKMFLSASGGVISPIISEYEVPNTEVSEEIYNNITKAQNYQSLVCSDNEYYYIITKKALAYMLKIKKSDMSMVKMEIPKEALSSGSYWGHLNIDNYQLVNGRLNGIAIKNGKIYIGRNDGKIVIIDSNTAVLLGEIKTQATSVLYNKSDGICSFHIPNYSIPSANLCRIKDLTGENYTLVKEAREYQYREGVRYIVPLQNTPFFLILNAISGIISIISAFADYLVTINNLQTPVTKTADKTMKITYIIEEA